MLANGKADLLTNSEKRFGSRMKKAGLGVCANHVDVGDCQGLSEQ